MEKFFKLKENGTSVKIEFIAGITTFVTMAYIIMVNPAMLATPFEGTDMYDKVFNGVFFATCLSAFLGTFLMGVLAKLPFAQAPGMGMNAFFTYTVMLGMGYSYEASLAMVFRCIIYSDYFMFLPGKNCNGNSEKYKSCHISGYRIIPCIYRLPGCRSYCRK